MTRRRCALVALLLARSACWRPPVASIRRATAARQTPVDDAAPADTTAGDAIEWTLAEDWAVRDRVDDFTAGSGDNARTFWAQLCAATPSLARRSAGEVEARHRALTGAAHPSPPMLDSWSRAPEGQFSGNLGGRTVWLTAALEGRFEGDPRAPAAGERAVMQAGGFVEALGGRVYELGAPAPATGATAGPAPTAGALTDSAPAPSRSVSSLAGTMIQRSVGSTALVALMWLGVGFGAGKIPPASSSSSPPPPPPEARTVVLRADKATPTSASSSGLRAAASSSQEPLTLQEKRQRQELRIEKDKLALELRRWQIKQDELQIKQDEQRLGELRRMEVERGAETVDAGVTQGAKRQDLESP